MNLSTGIMTAVVVFLVLLSAFFSAAEIGLMTLNRYRMRHLADSGHRRARVIHRLLERPDRLLGLILFGNNFANIAASSVTTLLTIRLFGATAVGIATLVLTLAILVFAEVAPKTLAALYPERVGLSVAYPLRLLLFVFYPLILVINTLANLVLRAFGVPLKGHKEQFGTEELKAVISEAATLIPKGHQAMLIGLLDLEKVTVDDVMVPRGEIEGVNLDADWDEIMRQIANSHYTRLPAYHGTPDNIAGILHLRKALSLSLAGRLDRETLLSLLIEPYFIPSATPLYKQLVNFKASRQRMGLVVDEYGDLMGLVTLEEILEEIVGDFTQNAGQLSDIRIQEDGTYLVNGGTSIRDLNRSLGWHLPINGPKTINGLIVEYLEDIPEPGTSLMLDGYLVEIVRTRGTAIQVVRIKPYEPSQKHHA
ncbi:MAG: HlyC/CorC family transporter [Acidiferrobacteraceae bacterium]